MSLFKLDIHEKQTKLTTIVVIIIGPLCGAAFTNKHHDGVPNIVVAPTRSNMPILYVTRSMSRHNDR